MKRLIRSKLTGEFLQPDGAWSRNFASAWDFSDIRSVIQAQQDFKLKGVELVLMPSDKPSAYDITIELEREDRAEA